MTEPQDMLITVGGAIKAIEGSPDRVGGYLVYWGSEAQADLQGEYFTPDTDLCLDWPMPRPALYHHGLDATLKTALIGQIDTLKADEVGLWAEAQLDMRNRYLAAIQQLIDRGVLHWSSGSLPHLVERVKGWISKWPIIEGSLTATPADWRQTTAITSLKFLPADALPLALPEEPPVASPDVPAVKEAAPPPPVVSSEPEQPSNGVIKMDIRQIALSILNQMLQARPDVQMTEDEKNALIEEVVSGMGMEAADAVPADQMDGAAGKAANVVATHLLAFIQRRTDYAATAQKAIANAAQNAMRNTPPSRHPAAFTGQAQPSGNPQPRIEQIVPLKFARLSAEDMSYLAAVRRQMNGKRGGYIFEDRDEESRFMRELADKAGKAYELGQVSFGDNDETTSAIKSINFMKANELNYSTQAGFGDEWVPNLWSSQIWEQARLNNVVFPLFQSIEMPSNPFEVPIEGADPTVYFVGETINENQLTLADSNSPIPDSKIGSGKAQLNAKKLALRVGISEELVEDSIIPIVSLYRKQAQQAMANAIDYVLLNGDTDATANTNINLIDGTPAATARYLAFNGIRKLSIITNTANAIDGTGLAPSLSGIRRARFAMGGQYSVDPQYLALITDASVYAKLLEMKEFITMDKAGALATAMKGQLGVVDGMPVLVSAQHSLANSAGKIPAAGGTLGTLEIVYTKGWYVGFRRNVKVNVDYIAAYDAHQLTATVRLAFVNFDTDVASSLYNLAV